MKWNTSFYISYIWWILNGDDETELISLEVNQKNKYLFGRFQNRFTPIYSLAEFIVAMQRLYIEILNNGYTGI